MTLTFQVGRSRSFESRIKSCREVSTVGITKFGNSFYRKTTKISDIISGPIYSKAVTFDLDLESQKKKWQEPFLKSTCEYKHFGI